MSACGYKTKVPKITKSVVFEYKRTKNHQKSVFLLQCSAKVRKVTKRAFEYQGVWPNSAKNQEKSGFDCGFALHFSQKPDFWLFLALLDHMVIFGTFAPHGVFWHMVIFGTFEKVQANQKIRFHGGNWNYLLSKNIFLMFCLAMRELENSKKYLLST